MGNRHMTAEEKMRKARVHLILNEPFYAILSMRLRLVEDPSCETALTDGVTIGYNPKWVDTLDFDQVVGLYVHEVDHVVFLHHLRIGDRDHGIWNMAGDYVINAIILSDPKKYKLPAKGLSDPKYKGKYTEEVYRELLDQHQKEPKQDTSSNGKAESGTGQPGQSQKDEGSEGSEGQSDSSGDAPPSSDQRVDKDPGRCGEVRQQKNKDGSEMTKPQTEAAEAELRVDIKAALQIAKGCGKVPAGIKEALKDVLPPIVNWQAVLQEFLTYNARDNYRCDKLNDNYVPMGLIMPIIDDPTLGLIGVYVDTSGSVMTDELRQFFGEIWAILGTYQGAEALLIQVDHAGYSPEIINVDTPIPNVIGRGGTSYRPPFEYVEKEGTSLVAAVYFTDGECDDFPEEEPDYPVLWILSRKNSSFKAPWGTTICME